MKPISTEKRELIIAANNRGEKPEIIAIWVDVCLKSVYNVINLYNENNSIKPKPYLGRPSSLSTDDLEKIRATVKKQNDITLEEIIEKLKLPIKKSRLSEILIEMNLSFKKRRSTRKINNARMSKKSAKNSENTNRI